MQIVRGGKVSQLHDLMLFVGKLSRLYSNLKHLIIKRKRFAGKPSRLEANPRKPQKFSTANNWHYMVYAAILIVQLTAEDCKFESSTQLVDKF